MKAKRKTKQIEKTIKKNIKKGAAEDDQHKGEPQLKSLSDFVTALTPVYASRPIYTGGRIITSQGKIFASCNQNIVVYDLISKSNQSIIKHINEEIVNFTVNLTGNKIATFSQNGLFRIMDVQTQKVLQITKLNAKLFPNDMAFSADAKYIALGFASQMVKIYTVQSLKQTHSYNHSAPVRKVQWNPNSETMQVVSSDDNRKIIIFDYIANKAIGQVQGGHMFSFCQNGKKIVTIFNQQIRVYLYKGLKLESRIQTGEYLQSLYCYGNSVLFGGEESQLLIWQIGQQRIRSIDKGTQKGVMKILGWQKQKKSIIISTQQNLTILDNESLLPEDIIIGYNDQIIDIKHSKSNPSDYFLLITNSSNVKIINRHTNALHCLLQGHSDIVLCGEYWHPWIATAGKDKIIKLWKINQAGRPDLVANYHGHSDDICGLGYLPKSHLLVTVGEDKTIKIWPICQAGSDSVEIHSALTTVMGHQKTINAVRVSVKQELIATCSHDRTVKVWDKNLSLLFTLSGHKRGVWDATFHDKQALLVTAGGDGMLKGWSMIDGQCVWSMGEGAGLVRCQWIYQHQIVTGSVDGILKIWDIRKKTSLSYDKHEGKIWAVQVRKDENNKCEVYTGANDSVYQVWMDSTEQTRERILKQGQADQKQKILFEQFRFDKQYLDAAKIAFDGDYTNLFMQVVEQMLGKFDQTKQVAMDEEGNITEEVRQNNLEGISLSLHQLVSYAFAKDANKLFNLVLTMNSTIKHFKAANKLFLEILKQNKLRALLQFDRTFILPERKEEIGQKQTDFQKFLKNMKLYTSKHQQRIQRYIRGSYWIDHLKQQQNPMTME